MVPMTSSRGLNGSKDGVISRLSEGRLLLLLPGLYRSRELWGLGGGLVVLIYMVINHTISSRLCLIVGRLGAGGGGLVVHHCFYC